MTKYYFEAYTNITSYVGQMKRAREGAAILTVSSLGKFEISGNGKVLNDDVMRSDMLTKLLMYLLIHREHPVSIQELSEALWSEDETDNPAGALKNLMYRLRTILKKTFGDEDYILTSRGVYSWNPKVEVIIDAEQFEQYCEEGKKTSDKLKSMDCYERAVELYQGDFMPRIMDRHWVMTLSTYYHSLLISAIKSLSGLYMKEERYEDVEHLCTEVLEYDSVDEWLHCTLITSLIRQNKQKLAMQQYEEAVKLLYDALGVRNSAQLKAVHEELLKMSKGADAEGIENVHEDMTEKEEPEGAYICGYPVFREIYRLEARKISRLGESEYILLMTLQLKDGAVTEDNKKMGKFLMKQAMNQVEEVLEESLRIGDVAARYSDSQFVVLLPTCTYESCLMVTQRILSRFYAKNKGRRIEIKTDYEEVALSATSLVR